MAAATSVSICDCNTASLVGSVDFTNFADCIPPHLPENQRAVEYSVLATQIAGQTFKGYACRMWAKELVVAKIFRASTDTLVKSSPLVAGAPDCWHLVQTVNRKVPQMV